MTQDFTSGSSADRELVFPFAAMRFVEVRYGLREDWMAERVGVEPTSPVLPGYPLSRRALSTTQTPLRSG